MAAKKNSKVSKRGALVDRMTSDELAKDVNRLIVELKKTTDQEAKKKIRRALRCRGHVGGLGAIAKK